MSRRFFTRSLVSVLAVLAAAVALPALATTAGAAPVPSITALSASASSVHSAGELVTITIKTKNAPICHLSVTPALAGLPRMLPCGSGTQSDVVTIPTNTGALRTFTFRARVGAGSSASSSTTDVTQQSGLSPLTWGSSSTVDPPQGGLISISCPTAVFCGGIDTAGNVVTLSSGAWSAPLAIGIASTQEGEPEISCAAPDTCVAIDGLGSAFTFNGSTWSGPTLVDPRLLTASLSCPTTTFCMMVDVTAQGATQMYLYNGATWSGPTDIDASDYGYGGNNTLSCTSSTFCKMADESGGIRSYNGVKWGGTKRVGDEGILAVSCASSSFCVASDYGGGVFTFTGSGWSTRAVVDRSGLNEISCPTSTSCSASDYQGRVLSLRGTHWSRPARVGPGADIYSISCAAPSSCAAADPESGKVFLQQGTTWSGPTLVDPYNVLISSSCPSSSFCMMVDTRGGVLTFNGATWSPVDVIDLGHAALSVSCPSTAMCVMTDDAGRALVERTGTWSSPTVVDPGERLVSVSCPTTTFCAAADERGRVSFFNGATWTPPKSSGLPVTLATPTIVGGGLEQVASAIKPILTSNLPLASEKLPPAAAAYAPDEVSIAFFFFPSYLVSTTPGTNLKTTLSCSSPKACTLAGGTDVVTYNGKRWRVPLVVTSGFSAGLSSLSCVSAWQCTAGTLEGPVIREVNGRWSAPTKLVSQAMFPQVSCTSGTFCGFVGNSRFAAFNGSSWSKNKLLFPSFLPSPEDLTYDTALACSGSSLCVAANDSGDAAVGTS